MGRTFVTKDNGLPETRLWHTAPWTMVSRTASLSSVGAQNPDGASLGPAEQHQ